jgi:4-aminobutyrate aminotransferase-like enzyme
VPGGLFPSMLAFGERPPLAVRSGRGMELTLEDGREVLDAGSLSANLLGHCHPALVEAVIGAARTVYVNDATGYGPRERAAEDLLAVAFAEEPWAAAVVFTLSSSEAADLALTLAQMLTGRQPLVSRELGYHGATGLGREVSSHPLWSHGLLSDTGVTLPRNSAALRTLSLPACGLTDLDPSHDCVASCLPGATEALRGAAAVIIDHSQAGVVASATYQDALASIAANAGALWIADETVTGLGRIGSMFAFQRGRSRPDMVTLGKGLTGSAAPGGALVLSVAVLEAIGRRKWMTTSTFRGHPVTVAAISAAMRTIESDRLIDAAEAHGARLRERLADVAARHAIVRRLKGDGVMWFMELTAAPEHGEEVWRGGGDAVPLTALVQARALEHGVLIGLYSGTLIWLIPPLIATAAQLDAVVDALDGALGEVTAGLRRGASTLPPKRVARASRRGAR